MAKSSKLPPPPWLAHIGSRERKKFKYELRRLGEHVASWSKRPDQPFKETSLGQETAYEADKAHPFALAAAHSLAASCTLGQTPERDLLAQTLAALLRRSLPCTADDLALLTGLVTEASTFDEQLLLLPGVLAAAERLSVSQPLPALIRQRLTEVRPLLVGSKDDAKKAAKLASQIEKLCDSSTVSRLSPDEGWADELRSWVEGLPAGQRPAWEALLRAAAAIVPEPPATSWNVEWSDLGIDGLLATDADFVRLDRLLLDRTPAADWRQEMAGHLDALGAEKVQERLRRSLHLVRTSKPGMLVRHSLNRELMRGLLWLCVDWDAGELAQALQQAATYFYENNSPLATAAVAVLCRMPGRGGASALTTIAARLKSESRRRLVNTALGVVAERLGVALDELVDDSLPSFGFTEPLRLVQQFGDTRAELRIVGSKEVAIIWSRKDKPLKSAPAAVKRDHVEGLANLTSTAAGVREALAGLATRLELMWLAERQLPLTVWREQLIDHPVAGRMGRSLVWQLSMPGRRVAALWHDGGLTTADGAAFDPPADATVSLWHPLTSTPADVLAWRERLEKLEVTQPFKQAHREIYVLTAAEQDTDTYSNRFAAHILRQAQFRVLAKTRGWTAQLVGPWDGGDRQAALRSLTHWNLGAEFWIQGAGDEMQTGFTYISTDQVRFNRMGETEQLPLAEIPPLVFSEIMRDVDLFVGVASVGNDPNWADGGPEHRYVHYWQSFAFGELSATAQTRRDVLARIIPRLKIAGRCSFEERFLVVEGKLRTYKIHLGSGNILMRPNDEYLCIVPGRDKGAAAHNVFLPFEGDRTLSIILSKALLLADDDQIKDETITRQIRR